MRVDAAKQKAAPGSGNGERTALCDAKQSCVIHISSVHDIEGTGLRNNQTQNSKIVYFGIGNLDKRGNRASQIQKRMHLDRALVLAEPCPWKKR